ncbi:MAG: hypothetical protein JXB15_03660, partial [Anaerolineales bacterium]|nr:hypothetical protein [Anaerolineales bacterium]
DRIDLETEQPWSLSPMIPSQHLHALQKIVTSLKGGNIDWAVTGSLGMALQGVPVEVHDIDIQTNKNGAYEIERLLRKFGVTPVRYVESERIRSYLGKLEIEGIAVEIMGDIQKRLEDSPAKEPVWEEPVKVEAYRQWVEMEGLQVPVLSLVYEYQAYLWLGRTEKAAMLREWLERQKSD